MYQTVRGKEPYLTADEADRALDAIIEAQPVPRHADLVAAFLMQADIAGGLWFYPGGTHTRVIIGRLADRPGVTIRGIVDRDSAAPCADLNLPVVTPEAVAAALLPGDRIVVSHQSLEATLIEALRAIGIAPDRIVAIFSDPTYQQFYDERTQLERLLGSLPTDIGRIRHVILRATNSAVIDDARLAAVFVPSETVVIGAARLGAPTTSRVYPTVNLHGQLSLLPALLDALDPQALYYQGDFDGFFQYNIVRRASVHPKLIFEMRDSWCIGLDYMSMKELSDCFKYPEEFLRVDQSEESNLYRDAVVTVTKRGGSWPALFDHPIGETLEYFVHIDRPDSPPSNRRPTEPGRAKRVVFASSVAVPSRLEGFPGLKINHDHLSMIERLTDLGAAQFQIFNVNDVGAVDNPYAPVAQRCADLGIGYAQRQPIDRLREMLVDFDYGWVRAMPAMRSRDHDVVIPATFSTYLMIGLPVIIHECLIHAADLVREFDAGIVVSSETPEQVTALICNADPERHRKGASALQAWMFENNQKTLARLRMRAS
jgi:hypothetical protein